LFKKDNPMLYILLHDVTIKIIRQCTSNISMTIQMIVFYKIMLIDSCILITTLKNVTSPIWPWLIRPHHASGIHYVGCYLLIDDPVKPDVN